MKTVVVKWTDAVGKAGWQKAMDVAEWAEDEGRGICWNTGYLFGENEDWVVLVSGFMNPNFVADAIRIPRAMILNIREVKYAEEA